MESDKMKEQPTQKDAAKGIDKGVALASAMNNSKDEGKAKDGSNAWSEAIQISYASETDRSVDQNLHTVATTQHESLSVKQAQYWNNRDSSS
ncbi:hypothetical protein KIN20_006778 [Parelaphostrongylus tenuis]|uniref:Uncharacterized protein n=1 Tax=Parelaphostrongylus tenuis TaxID=148309 RepID=A0AAD5MKL3_PARTN|nr:hypothetical protein KIN20_006778 [Parelaphostrongylus tenuis]